MSLQEVVATVMAAQNAGAIGEIRVPESEKVLDLGRKVSALCIITL